MFLRVGGAVRIRAERKGIRLQIKSRRMRWNRAIQMAIRLNLLILPWLKANTRRCSGDIGGKVDVDDDVDENCAAAAAGRELSSPTPTHPDDGIGPPIHCRLTQRKRFDSASKALGAQLYRRGLVAGHGRLIFTIDGVYATEPEPTSHPSPTRKTFWASVVKVNI